LARTIDSLLYSPKWGGLNGSSLERINPAISSNDALNWGTSKDPQKGTPGRINSLTKKDYDLLLNKITSVPYFPF